jgi:hypothetical protein
MGLLSINADQGVGDRSNQLSVARGTWQVNDNVRTGFIATQGNPLDEVNSQTIGTDLSFRSNNFNEAKTLELGAWLQQNETAGIENDNLAWGVSAAYPNDIVKLSFDFKELQKNFNPALGFVNRNNIRQYAFEGRHRNYIDNPSIHSIDTSVNSTVTTDLAGNLKTSKTYFNFFDLTLKQGDFFRLAVEDSKDNLSETFKLLGVLNIAPDNYHYNRYWVTLNSSSARKWGVNATWHFGDFYSGDKKTTSVEFKWRPTLHINSAIKLRSDDIKISSEHLKIRQIKLTLDYIFNNKLSWQNYFQYDDFSRQLGVSSRLHWVYQPGFESHFIINSNYFNSPEDSWQRQAKEITLRLGGVWRF